MEVSGCQPALNNGHAHSSALHINPPIPTPASSSPLFGFPFHAHTAHLDTVCSHAFNWLSRAAVQKLVEPTRHRGEK